MAQIEQEIADKVTFIVSFPKSDQNKKDLIPIIQLESADHVYLSLANYNHDTLKARNELYTPLRRFRSTLAAVCADVQLCGAPRRQTPETGKAFREAKLSHRQI